MVASIFVLSFLLVGLAWADTGYFWQINDFHYDPTYDATGGNSCNPNRPQEPMGEFGDVACDAPWRLVESSVMAMKELDEETQSDFIIWLGDNVYHPLDHDLLNQEDVIEMTINTSKLLQHHFPNKPVFASLGNHDYYPTNDLPGGNSTIYDAVAQAWEQWLETQETIDRFKSGAFYSRLLDGSSKLRMVIANTNLYFTSNSVTKGDSDPGEQFQWLEDTLTQARSEGEKIYMLIHIPSGYLPTDRNIKWFTDEANAQFNDIVRKYSDIILGVFSCHEHSDSFRVFHKDGQPVVPMLVAPAVTPWRARIPSNGDFIYFQARNPAVRRYKYDRSNGQLLDFEQYMLNLPLANSDHTTTWELQYTFSKAYKEQDLSAASLNRLLQDFKKDDSQYFSNYFKYVFVSSNDSSVTNLVCGCTCKKQHLCGIEYVDVQTYTDCISQESVICAASSLFLSFNLLALSMLCILKGFF